MDRIEWSKKQEEIHLRPSILNWSTRQVKIHGEHFFNLIVNDTDIKKDDPILFLGCNDGGHVEQFVNKGYNAYGCDLPGLINYAKKMKPEIADRLYIGNLETLEHIPSFYSWKLVVAKSVIEHLVTWFELPKKIANVQSSNGKVWICTKDGTKSPYPEDCHFIHIPFNVLEYIFKDAGYSIVKHYDPEGYPHNGLAQMLVGKKE